MLRAEGRDARHGSATVTATLTPDGSGTKVVVSTDLTVAGKVAQFGRDVLAAVSVKLLDEFAQCLSEELESEQATSLPEDVGAVAGGPGVRQGDGRDLARSPGGQQRDECRSPPGRLPEPAPVDLLGTAGPPLAKRLVPAGLLAALVVLLLLRRRRR